MCCLSVSCGRGKSTKLKLQGDSTYSAFGLAGKVLGGDQAGEEEREDGGLHCEGFRCGICCCCCR